MRSINDARYTMWATVIPRLDPTNQQPAGTGHFQRAQDQDTGAITTVWVADQNGPVAGSVQAHYDIPCYARGYTNLGFRSSANREVFVASQYNIIEAIQFDYPASVTLNHQSFITRIRGRKDDTDYLWTYEDTGNPIVWEVQGTTPVTDPFGKLLRYTTVLKRSEVQ